MVFGGRTVVHGTRPPIKLPRYGTYPKPTPAQHRLSNPSLDVTLHGFGLHGGSSGSRLSTSVMYLIGRVGGLCCTPVLLPRKKRCVQSVGQSNEAPRTDSKCWTEDFHLLSFLAVSKSLSSVFHGSRLHYPRRSTAVPHGTQGMEVVEEKNHPVSGKWQPNFAIPEAAEDTDADLPRGVVAATARGRSGS